MSLETGVDGPEDLVVANPAAGDALTEGDDHLRLVKVAVKRFCWEHVGTSAVAAAASISTYSLFGAFETGYDYLLTLEGVYLSASSNVGLRVTTGGGTVDSGSNYASSGHRVTSASSSGTGTSSATNIVSLTQIGDASAEAGHAEILILNPAGTTNPRHMLFKFNGGTTVTNLYSDVGGCMYRTTTAVDGLYVAEFGSGYTLTCTLKLYRRFRPT
jgi:hypothetical protein